MTIPRATGSNNPNRQLSVNAWNAMADKLNADTTVRASTFIAAAASVTAGLKAAFDYAIPLGLPVVLEGDYTVDGPLQTFGLRASGGLHIVCVGNVTITVSPSAATFRDFLYFESTSANNVSITGGSLTVNCNNRAASGIGVRHYAATQGGTVHFGCPVTVLNCTNNDAAANFENQAIGVYGDYAKIAMDRPTVIGVNRTNATAATKGISISAFSGQCTVNQPHIENIFTPGAVDSDGLAIFGKAIGTTYNARAGVAYVNEPVFIDCQGRSFKSQCSDTTVFRPKVKRQMAVAIANAVEFDFQAGNGLVVEPDYEYRLNGATSPIGASHSCVAFQQLNDNQVMRGKALGGTLRTEAAIPRYALVVNQFGSLYSESEVSGLRVIPIGSFATSAFSRAIVETDMATVVAKSAPTKIIVRDVSGPLQCYGIGYTAYTSGDLSAKLSWEVSGLNNTLGPASAARPFVALSGSAVAKVASFVVRNNIGYRDLATPGWTFTFNQLAPGTTFTVDLASVVATGAPAWGASGYATIEVLGCYFGATDKTIRVTKGNADAANTVFHTQNGGATWGTIK